MSDDSANKSADGGGALPHVCPLCAKRFAQKRYLRGHVRRVHETATGGGEQKAAGSHSCGICDKRFASVSQLQRHQLFHYGVREHECAECSAKFTLAEHLRRHVRAKHAGGRCRPYQCAHCQMKFVSRWESRRHERRMHTTVPLRCDRCPGGAAASFSRADDWLSHMRLHHGGGGGAQQRRLCPQCGRSYTGDRELRAHVAAVHRRRGAFKCLHCEAVFAQRVQVDRHIVRSHYASTSASGRCPLAAAQHLCAPSDCTYATAAALREHVRAAHERPQAAVCQYCWLLLDNEAQRKRHAGQRHFVKLRKAVPLSSGKTG